MPESGRGFYFRGERQKNPSSYTLLARHRAQERIKNAYTRAQTRVVRHRVLALSIYKDSEGTNLDYPLLDSGVTGNRPPFGDTAGVSKKNEEGTA